MKRNRRKQIFYHPLTVEIDKEGGPCKNYAEGKALKAIVWPASSKLQIAQYGNEVNRIQNVKVEGKYSVVHDEKLGIEIYQIGEIQLKENDGIRIHARERPDYRIISIKPYQSLLLEVKKL